MNTQPTTTPEHDGEFKLTCEQFAGMNMVRPQSVRARICRTGSYFGVMPKKLANGRLAFPAVQIARQ